MPRGWAFRNTKQRIAVQCKEAVGLFKRTLFVALYNPNLKRDVLAFWASWVVLVPYSDPACGRLVALMIYSYTDHAYMTSTKLASSERPHDSDEYTIPTAPHEAPRCQHAMGYCLLGPYAPHPSSKPHAALLQRP